MLIVYKGKLDSPEFKSPHIKLNLFQLYKLNKNNLLLIFRSY